MLQRKSFLRDLHKINFVWNLSLKESQSKLFALLCLF